MGEVYQARDTRLDRTVAIKIMPRRTRGGPAVPRSLRARGPHHLPARSSQHLCALRRRPGARNVVSGHAVSGGRNAATRLIERSAAALRRVASGHRDRGRADACAQGGRRAPRPQAGQRDADPLGLEASRLRPRKDAGRGRQRLGDADHTRRRLPRRARSWGRSSTWRPSSSKDRTRTPAPISLRSALSSTRW